MIGKRIMREEASEERELRVDVVDLYIAGIV